MTRAGYLTAALVVPWLLADVENRLEHSDDGETLDTAFVQDASRTRLPSAAEIQLVIEGLTALGVLVDSPGGLRLRKTALTATSQYRQGVQDAITASEAAHRADDTALCASIPTWVPNDLRDCVRAESADLRAAIVGVISSARRRLVLASPFWDVDTAVEIGDIVRRRVESGVVVDVLSRSGDDPGVVALRRAVGFTTALRIYAWYERAAETHDTTTFHFKAVIADDGERAYLGSANLTRSGLRATMELGLIVKRDLGLRIARIVDGVIAVANRVVAG